MWNALAVGKPSNGYTKKVMAQEIHGLATSL
jgi:hypothetical protein